MDRRRDPRCLLVDFQQRRRQEALERQRAAREATARARRLARGGAAEAPPAAGGARGGTAAAAAAPPAGVLGAMGFAGFGGARKGGRGGSRGWRDRAQDSSSDDDDDGDDSGAAMAEGGSEEEAVEAGEEDATKGDEGEEEEQGDDLIGLDWALDAPPDLAISWLALPRPEGRRVLVTAARGKTIARSQTGHVVSRFESPLPGGNSRSRAPPSLLDCVWAEDGTFWILDVPCWRGNAFLHCTFEFRRWWIDRFAEELEEGEADGRAGGRAADRAEDSAAQTWRGDGRGARGARGGRAAAPPAPRSFRALPCVPATGPGIRSVARWWGTDRVVRPATRTRAPGRGAGRGSAAPGAALARPIQDGVFLVHREARYVSGISPLYLVWKDRTCARYVVDTDAHGKALREQEVILRRLPRSPEEGDSAPAASEAYGTADDPPIVLYRGPAESAPPGAPDRVASASPRRVATASPVPALAGPPKLARFRLGPGGVSFDPATDAPSSADLVFLGAARSRSAKPHSISRILFQRRARDDPDALGIEALVRAAGEGSAGEASGGNGGAVGGAAEAPSPDAPLAALDIDG